MSSSLASFPLNFVSFFQFFAIFYMILSILPIKEIFQSLRQHRKKMHVLPILGQLQMQSAKVMASTRRPALSGILVCSPEVTLTYEKGQVSILDFTSTVSTGNKHDQKTKRGPRNSATFSLILIQVYLAAKELKIALNSVVLVLTIYICKMSKNVRKGSTCEKCVQLTEGRRVVNFLASRISCNWKGNTNDINWYSEPIPENPRIRWDHASKVKLVTWKKTDMAWVSTYQSTYISIHRIYTYIKSNWLSKVYKSVYVSILCLKGHVENSALQ